MFKKEKKVAVTQARIDSLIGVGTRIDGSIKFTGGLRVDGEIRGMFLPIRIPRAACWS